MYTNLYNKLVRAWLNNSDKCCAPGHKPYAQIDINALAMATLNASNDTLWITQISGIPIVYLS